MNVQPVCFCHPQVVEGMPLKNGERLKYRMNSEALFCVLSFFNIFFSFQRNEMR